MLYEVQALTHLLQSFIMEDLESEELAFRLQLQELIEREHTDRALKRGVGSLAFPLLRNKELFAKAVKRAGSSSSPLGNSLGFRLLRNDGSYAPKSFNSWRPPPLKDVLDNLSDLSLALASHSAEERIATSVESKTDDSLAPQEALLQSRDCDKDRTDLQSDKKGLPDDLADDSADDSASLQEALGLSMVPFKESNVSDSINTRALGKPEDLCGVANGAPQKWIDEGSSSSGHSRLGNDRSMSKLERQIALCDSISCWKTLLVEFKRGSVELSEREQLDKAVADIQSEIAAQELCQVWRDEILARRIECDINTKEFPQDAKSTSKYDDEVYDLYYAVASNDQGYVGVACVIKDRRGNEVLENKSCLGTDVSQHFAEYTALINGVAYARSAGVERVNACGNRPFIHLEMKGFAELWTSEQVELLQKLQREVAGLRSFNMSCVSTSENQGAIDMAKCAIAIHLSELKRKYNKLSPLKRKTPILDQLKECLICYEKTFASDMVQQKGCDHQFCYNCLSRHIENDIAAGRVPVRCPQFYECSIHMDVDDCQRLGLLSQKSFEIYSKLLAEATVSDLDKVYCPFPACSAVMCLMEDRSSLVSAECMECHRLFCAQCQVPWHNNLSCQQYQHLPRDERDAEDIKLFELAKNQNWRRCKQCRRMIIRSEGCFHMTCRCGYQFCYRCETPYKRNNVKACTCPLFATS